MGAAGTWGLIVYLQSTFILTGNMKALFGLIALFAVMAIAALISTRKRGRHR
jgi:hypothetical protein